METYKVAILGYGNIAEKHLNILFKIFPNNKFLVFRKYFEKKIKYKKKNVIELNIKNILNYDFENLLMTNPANLHYFYLKKLYKKKINFFIEKPLFDKPQNINKIISFQKKNKLKIQTGYLFRYDNLINKFKDLISNNLNSNFNVEIICESNVEIWPKRPVNNLNTSISSKTAGGVLNELSHEIDYCLYLFGKPKKLFAMNLNSKMISDCDTYDQTNIIFFYKKNIRINIRLSFNQKISKRHCLISNNNGYYFMDLINRNIEIKKGSSKKNINVKNDLSDSYYKQLKVFFYDKNFDLKNLRHSLEVLNIIRLINLSNKKNSIIDLKSYE